MRRYLHLLAALAFVLMLGYDFWLWGGLSKTPGYGRHAAEASARELSLATIYVPAGAGLLDALGQGPAAARHAQSVFAPLEAALLANPEAAMETLATDMPTQAKLPYYGAPAMLLLAALLWWLRPRMVHSAMSRRG